MIHTKTTITATTTSVSKTVNFFCQSLQAHTHQLLTMTQCCFNPADELDDRPAKYSLCFSSIECYKEHPLSFSQCSFYLDFWDTYVSRSYSSDSTM